MNIQCPTLTSREKDRYVVQMDTCSGLNQNPIFVTTRHYLRGRTYWVKKHGGEPGRCSRLLELGPGWTGRCRAIMFSSPSFFIAISTHDRHTAVTRCNLEDDSASKHGYSRIILASAHEVELVCGWTRDRTRRFDSIGGASARGREASAGPVSRWIARCSRPAKLLRVTGPRWNVPSREGNIDGDENITEPGRGGFRKRSSTNFRCYLRRHGRYWKLCLVIEFNRRCEFLDRCWWFQIGLVTEQWKRHQKCYPSLGLYRCMSSVASIYRVHSLLILFILFDGELRLQVTVFQSWSQLNKLIKGYLIIPNMKVYFKSIISHYHGQQWRNSVRWRPLWSTYTI